MKRRWVWTLIIIVFIVGLGVVLYPPIAKRLSARNQEIAIRSYFDDTASITDEDIDNRFKNADIYNNMLAGGITNNGDYKSYANALALGEDNIICVLEIPKISVRLPVYSSTSDDDLEKGAGHIKNTSLPIGNKGSHSLISAHRGLSKARMFRDLDQLQTGDEFYIYVLNRKLEYVIDDIRVVEPDDVSSIEIDENNDYVTLVTCTPYIINSHRLLVRGERKY